MEKEKPELIFQKEIKDVSKRITIPKICVDRFGYRYYLEVYKDKMVLKPIKK